MASAHEIHRLLEEFYSYTTTNSRKREIEVTLQGFQKSPEVWKSCLNVIGNSSVNQIVWFFSASTLENTIQKRWLALNAADRLCVRESLWKIYVGISDKCSNNSTSNKLQRDKTAQLIALIGKKEFPEQHANYMEQIVELVQKKFILGIILLRATCEELLSTRSDISTERKQHLSYCISVFLPSFIPAINEYLTPITTPHQQKDHFYVENCKELLRCIQVLFQCDILHDEITTKIIENLFLIARYNPGTDDTDIEISVGAITALSELFLRQRKHQSHATIASGLIQLLKSGCTMPKTENHNNLAQYEQSLTELFKSSAEQLSIAWWRKTNIQCLEEYLGCLWQYTIYNVDDPITFKQKLSVWVPIIKYYGENKGEMFPDKCMTIVIYTLKRMLLQFDDDRKLQAIYDQCVDDPDSEWQSFLSQCLEVVSLIAYLNPQGVNELICNEFIKSQGPLDIFVSLMKTNDETFSSLCNDQVKCQYLQIMFRDLATEFQLVARTFPVISEVANGSNGARISAIISSLCETLQQALVQIHNWRSFKQQGIYQDLNYTVAQLVVSLIYLVPISDIQNNVKNMTSLIESTIQTILSSSSGCQLSKILTTAIGTFLLNITSNLRPKYLLESNFIPILMKTNLSSLEKSASQNIYKALFNCLVLQWRGVSAEDQNIQHRTAITQEFVLFLGCDILKINESMLVPGSSLPDSTIKAITNNLFVFQDILEYYEDSNSFTKSILTNALRPVIEKAVFLFNVFHHQNPKVIEQILNFFNSLIKTLQTQLGASAIKELLLLFIESCKKEQLEQAQLRWIDKLLHIFLVIIKQHGNSSAALIPDILNLTLEQVAPLVFNLDINYTENIDVIMSLYALFDGILQNRWQYFYKSQVLRGFSPGASDETGQNDMAPAHSEQFSSILTAYGHALTAFNHPDMMRVVLESLQSIDEKYKLFHSHFFIVKFSTAFQCAILRCLAAPEGSLNFDLLLGVLFKMSQQGQILEQVLRELDASMNRKTIEAICTATDFPTFAFNVSHLVQDIKYCQNVTQH
uniref:CSON012831 protein n=1 Tax=Culicoides sonorensis TaxID=179676 RepID=A0A336MAF9_CULSO